MNKLSRDFLEKNCTAENCCDNEFAALPQSGDAGFEEYFEHKSKKIKDAKQLFCPPEQTRLMLAYPHPDDRGLYVFERFFESPSVVAKNQEFEGCFAIDITDYVGKTDDAHFQKLITYMHRSKTTVFMPFIYSDNKKEIQSMFEVLNSYEAFRLINIPLPDAKALTEYTVSGIRDFTLHICKPAEDHLREYYGKAKCGYDLADYLIRYLKSVKYSGELPEMEEAIKKIDRMWHSNGAGAGFGY